MSWPGRPPTAEILLGTPQSWARLGREDAVRYCRMLPVAVVYSNYGQSQSAWFGPGSPFYTVDGPYDYGSLRYFAMAGGGGSMVWGKGTGTSKKPKQGETPVEVEPEGIPSEEFEPLEEAPAAPKPPKPALPAAPGVPKPFLPPQPAIPQAPQIPQPPKLPEMPKVPETPKVPEIPQPPGIPAVPEVPGIPALPKLPPKEKLPVEIQLVDSQGKANAGTAYELRFPDGSSQAGVTGSDGFIKVPDNEMPGEVELILKDGKK